MSSLPKRFPDRVDVASVRAEAERLEPGQEGAEERRVAGRVLARRGHGKLVFLDLFDRSGRLQLLVEEGRAGPVDLDLGDIVGAAGKPARTRRGEPSLAVDELQPLAKIRVPLPDTFHGVTDVEQRYRRRHLDLLMNETTRADFELRTRMVTAIRRYLDEHGFLEVETPILQPRYGGAFAEPFVTHSNALDADLYLRIATELYLKRLIVGGLERVYELGKDFRNEGLSYKHQPEFTMVEWYEAYADYRDTMARIEELIPTVAEEATGGTKSRFRGHDVDLASWRRVKLVDAFEEQGLWTRDSDELRARLHERGIDTTQDKTWAQLADHALSSFVEPNLIEPTILYDYPIELSPFARSTDDDPSIVERFEFFVGGMELGNAFSEINDAEEQAERFAMQGADRAAGDVTAEEGDPDYVEALSYGMPPTGGLGFGIDRLALVLTGRETIRDVILFPALRSVRQ
jgi:lysyl-tRNA synthetase class 2